MKETNNCFLRITSKAPVRIQQNFLQLEPPFFVQRFADLNAQYCDKPGIACLYS